MNFFQRLFRKEPVVRPAVVWPERPADWKFTMSDLMQQMKGGKISSIRQPELGWARDYERSLIPAGVRFPVKGDVYESLREQPISYMTAWMSPYTGSGEAVLMQGERVWINSAPRDEMPIGANAIPMDYKRLEERMVPADIRQAGKYGGFYFFLNTTDLNKNFKLVATGYCGG